MSIYTPVYVALGILVASLVARRLKQAVQPLRLAMADIGEELIANDNVPCETREAVKICLDMAFGARWFLVLAIIAAPLFAIIWLVKPNAVAGRYIKDDVLRLKSEEFDKLNVFVMAANNPILFAIVFFEFMIFSPLVFLGMALRGKLSMASVVSNSDKAFVRLANVERKFQRFNLTHAT